MFSARSAFDLRPNRFGLRLAELRRQGAPLIDLTESNPTAVGLESADLAALADPRGRRYRPEPFGSAAARAMVADGYYRGRGVALDPERLILTASTSEAYGFLFTLLCDPGDEVLVPRPSYPLFDYLAALASVTLRPYPLDPERGFALDPEALAAAAGPRTRAVMLVSPNNPTGGIVGAATLAELDRLAAERGLAIVSDEVFADFPLAAPGLGAPVAASLARDALTFSLSGLSKVCGLPQLKLGWMALGGPPAQVAAALARLEVIADTFLSVATPVQLALPALLAAGASFRDRCRARILRNRAALAAAVAATPGVQLLAADAGWYACLRVPRLGSEEELVLELLDRGVVVHPGYFFDFPVEGWLVLSLIVEPEAFAAAARTVLDRFR